MSTARRTKARQPKRGIVLILVVSLLALFILMGVTFALVSSAYLSSSKVDKEIQRVGDNPAVEADLVMQQVLCDTFARTPLQTHSLLADLYGGDWVKGTVSTVFPSVDAQPGGATQGQLIKLRFPVGSFSQVPHYYAGRVITFTKGAAVNHSTRVVDSFIEIINPGPVVWYALIIEAIESKTAGFVVPQTGDEFVINGAPFNGTGAGYDTQTRGLDAVYAAPDGAGGYLNGYPVSLLPHYSAYDAAGAGYFNYSGMPTQQVPNLQFIGTGGVDEPWDAPDLQNLFLAMVPPRAAEQFYAGSPLPIIPSYHRPELINYWVNYMASSMDPRSPLNPAITAAAFQAPAYKPQRDFLRSIIFRPMPWDHSNFTGGNPYLDPINYPNVDQLIANLINSGNAAFWDVDNDGDGVPDSIWLDPGLPVITTPDGRRYKRLVAILIKDLDGSIDLNAHGNLYQTTQNGSNYAYRAEFQVQGQAAPNNLGLLAASAYLPRGLGFGPAEVDFLNILTTTSPAYTDANAVSAYQELIYGRYSSTQTNDYGNTSRPGLPGTREALNYAKHHGVPNDYINGGTNGMWYASPPDVWGKGAVVLDVGGHPLHSFMGQSGDMLDNPYEMSLSGQYTNTDSPYSPAEVERLLRYHDNDMLQFRSTLPNRQRLVDGSNNLKSYLATATPGVIDGSHHIRNMLAGMTSHVPAPATTIPQEMRLALASMTPAKTPGTASILDLYNAKLQNAGLSGQALNTALQQIAPFEFFHGQKFDINRWLGDGLDTNGDGVVDDPRESDSTLVTETAWTLGPANFPGVTAWHSNDGVAVDNKYARQLYARHLFCLAMLFMPNNFPTLYNAPLPNDGAINNSQALYRKLVVRRLAQWAVNCVDFRDPDSIMTAFEYDENPWNGWQVDGNPGTDGNNENLPMGVTQPGTDRGLVWGMEEPDLLITETLAFHDRRVKDTDKDNMSAKKRTDMMTPDPNLDQFRIPEGSLFLELYCPRSVRWTNLATPQTIDKKPLLPQELYINASTNNPSLVLGLLAPGGRPVWRLAFSKLAVSAAVPTTAQQKPLQPGQMANTNPESASYDPYSPNLLVGQQPAGQVIIDRYAYFVNATASLTAPEVQSSFYFNTTTPLTNTLLSPGQYAVLGSRPTTYLGSQDPATANPMPAPNVIWGGNSPQYIQLGGANGVTVVNTTGTTTSRTPGTGNINKPVPFTCGMYGVTPTGWTQQRDIGLNLTEPLPSGNYYPQPAYSGTPMGATQADFYDNPDTTMAAGTFIDEPVEHPAGAGTAGRPIADHSMTKTGTYLNASSVYLQRLANPSLAYNPPPNSDPYVTYNANAPANPYITVDWAQIDVTVFSGEENTTNPGTFMGMTGMLPLDPDDDPSAAISMHFRTRQRGYMPTGMASGQTTSNPWPPQTQNGAPLPQTAAGAAPGPYFQVDLSNDLNTQYTVAADRHTLGYLNGTIDPYPLPAPYLGEPGLGPFPWLTWHNRPFANPMELLVVPTSSPSRIFTEISPGFPSGGTLATSPYLAAGSGANEDALAFRTPYAHLLNFFETDNPQNGVQGGNAPHFYRLLDFIEVPSPYAGAERWYNPSQFGAVPLTFLPPFNKMSRFRDSGRININTIFDTSIWDAAVGLFPGMRNADNFANKVFLSRQGDGGTVVGQMNPAYPTRFANPFRPADAADLMPNLGAPNMRKISPVEATFLRSDPDTTTFAPPNQQPLFQINTTNPLYNQWVGPTTPRTTFSAMPDPTYPGECRDINRNPYFRYQALQKLGNIFTTQSNCFAVWMTIGYFEVEENTASVPAVDQAHPDGLMLGQEVGLDTGTVHRHRAFFIIDRSIPVGFQPGQRLNTDDCILVRRMIE